MDNQYHFVTRWRVRDTAEQVYNILSDPLELPRWWPSVYLSVRQLTPRRVRVRTKGWLPYTLKWDAVISEAQPPNRWVVRATGDFEGRGIWSIVQDGEYADITFDWKLTATKPFLRYLSFALKPIFEANHRWAMELGRQSLELELARARAATVEQMNSVPKPPQPEPFWSRELAAETAITIGLAAGLWTSRRA